MKIGRNDLCPCGSGKKFKKCHLLIQDEAKQIENDAWNKWYAQDIAKGKENKAAYEAKLEEVKK